MSGIIGIVCSTVCSGGSSDRFSGNLSTNLSSKSSTSAGLSSVCIACRGSAFARPARSMSKFHGFSSPETDATNAKSFCFKGESFRKGSTTCSTTCVHVHVQVRIFTCAHKPPEPVRALAHSPYCFHCTHDRWRTTLRNCQHVLASCSAT